MSVAIDLGPGNWTWSLAISLVVISIMLSALALGIGRALGSRKLWAWGAEELGQAIFNAAILGALFGLTAAASVFVSSSVPSGTLLNCASTMNLTPSHSAMNASLCSLELAGNATQNVSGALFSHSYKFAMLSSLTLSANVLTARPLAALEWPAHTYADWSAQLTSLDSLIETQRQFLAMVASMGFALFLPAGLLLRMFFPTRRLGASIMGAAIAFFLVYPMVYASLAGMGPLAGTQSAVMAVWNDNENSVMRDLPIIDWDKPGDMMNITQGLEKKDLAARAISLSGPMSAFFGSLNLYAIVYPLIALVMSLVAAAALAGGLGTEMRLDLFEMV